MQIYDFLVFVVPSKHISCLLSDNGRNIYAFLGFEMLLPGEILKQKLVEEILKVLTQTSNVTWSNNMIWKT